MYNEINIRMCICAIRYLFHLFSYGGGWSTDGVTAKLVDSNTVQCITTHLTSFSVLVGPSGSKTTSVRQ